MARLHLVLGPVGAGKSTYCAKLSEESGAVWFNLDEWMATLYGQDERPEGDRVKWYVERTERCIEQIRRSALRLLELDVDVVLELGLVRRQSRHAFYESIDPSAPSLVVHVLDVSEEERWKRVQRRNEDRGATFSMVVPEEVFRFASSLWEPPDELERTERNVIYPNM